MIQDPNIKKVPCPICKKESPWHENPFRPFCSKRCKLIDLGEWASERYRFEGTKEKKQGEDPAE